MFFVSLCAIRMLIRCCFHACVSLTSQLLYGFWQLFPAPPRWPPFFGILPPTQNTRNTIRPQGDSCITRLDIIHLACCRLPRHITPTIPYHTSSRGPPTLAPTQSHSHFLTLLQNFCTAGVCPASCVLRRSSCASLISPGRPRLLASVLSFFHRHHHHHRLRRMDLNSYLFLFAVWWWVGVTWSCLPGFSTFFLSVFLGKW